MTILEVDNVAKRFGKLAAVKGISLEIPEGQIRGLIGPNGSGKTTMFHLISGFLRPTSPATSASRVPPSRASARIRSPSAGSSAPFSSPASTAR